MPSLVLFQFMQIGSVEYSCLWLWNHKRNFQVGVSPVARLHFTPLPVFRSRNFFPNLECEDYYFKAMLPEVTYFHPIKGPGLGWSLWLIFRFSVLRMDTEKQEVP